MPQAQALRPMNNDEILRRAFEAFLTALAATKDDNVFVSEAAMWMMYERYRKTLRRVATGDTNFLRLLENHAPDFNTDLKALSSQMPSAEEIRTLQQNGHAITKYAIQKTKCNVCDPP